MPLKGIKRLVLKIGSSLLVNQESGTLHRAWLESLIEDVAFLRSQNIEVVIVTSGAVALGRRPLGLKGKPLLLEEKQAAAAVGQIKLAQAYQEILAKHGIAAAQMLLTPYDSEDRKRYLNAQGSLNTLLSLGAVPVINENDCVATQELRFGDNDRLAARVAQMADADVLVLFSDIDGLYSANPRTNPDAKFIPEVRDLTPEIEAMAGDPGSAVGSGGMVTKLMAARISLSAGCKMAIALGQALHPLKTLWDGGRATWFIPSGALNARKQWIAGSLALKGALLVDEGAVRALRDNRSLLPAGVIGLEGNFIRGDRIAIKDRTGLVIGRGIVGYGTGDALRILGKKSGEIKTILGPDAEAEIIHRDDLVID